MADRHLHPGSRDPVPGDLALSPGHPAARVEGTPLALVDGRDPGAPLSLEPPAHALRDRTTHDRADRAGHLALHSLGTVDRVHTPDRALIESNLSVGLQAGP